VTLQEWFEKKDIPYKDSLCVTLGTDGLDPKKDQIISISYSKIDDEPAIVYIKDPVRDANIKRVAPFTEVTEDHYLDNAIYFNEAVTNLQPILDNAEFIVTYSYNSFFKEWSKIFTPFLEIPVLDVVSIFKLRDRYGTLNRYVDSIKDLNKSISEQTDFIQTGYSLSTLENRFLGNLEFKENVPKLEQQIYKLVLLYKVALQLEL
jgi:hypothetical protein